jgi:predicted ATPase
MPEELEKATGTYYTPPITGGLFGHFLGIRRAKQLQGEMFGQTSDFAAFLEVLKARCDFWHLEGARDWRRREAEVFLEDKSELFDETLGILEALKSEAGAETSGQTEEQAVALEKPSKFILSAESEPSWNKVIEESVHREAPVASIPWQSGELIVYARAVRVPKQYGRVCYWDFNELVESFGPADYISLASNFHTFIIDRVPVLTLSMKNEARRFITFLDALYEARCKLIIRAEVGPDDLFFPDMRPSSTPTDGMSSPGEVEDSEDATYSETVAEVFQDQVSPFRPNVSTYSESPNSRYPDQDSEFGMEKKVDFVKTGSAFTGEDERFAYKRAASRLWELCSAQWHARTGDWWQPLPAESRHWEGSEASVPLAASPPRPAPTDVTYGPVVEFDEPAGLARLRIDFLKKKHQE